jgi:surfactin family lipopeptide synthetase A/lichenysin synthetase A
MVFAFTIDGEIVPEKFQAAFQALVNRSDALRTVIELIDGVPRQRVVPRLPYSMEFIDLSTTPDAERVYRNW